MWSETETFVKNRKCGQKQKLLSKTENFCQKSNIIIKNLSFFQKLKILSKILTTANILDFFG